ncbi:MAG: peptidoglycan editing factor PgeF [Pseudomonadota bacterium]
MDSLKKHCPARPEEGLAGKVLEFEVLKRFPLVAHGVFNRNGGVSAPPFDSLNVGLNCGDEPDRVAENRNRIIRHLGGGRPVFLSQVHGDRIAVIKSRGIFLGSGDQQPPLSKHLPEPDGRGPRNGLVADGVITDVPGLLLVIQVADCQSVMLFDPRRRVIANIHSGWRGSISDINGQAVAVMVREFNCDPRDIRAGISPSLGPCCAEFIHYETEIPRHLWHYMNPGHRFDFWGMSRDQLLGKGLRQENIHISGICTRCCPEKFYSYRHEHVTGRFASVIGLMEPKETP